MRTGAPSEAGFTLVELLVSLLIFGMLSTAGVALLSFSVRAQDGAERRLGEVAAMRRLGAILAADLAQAVPRPHRDESGARHRAFSGVPEAMRFVRAGWDNPDGQARSSLQKVDYAFRQGRLERTAYRHVDGAAPMPATLLIDGVRTLRLRYRDEEGTWRDRWDPTRATALPHAVELVLETERGQSVRQLFLAGSPA